MDNGEIKKELRNQLSGLKKNIFENCYELPTGKGASVKINLIERPEKQKPKKSSSSIGPCKSITSSQLGLYSEDLVFVNTEFIESHALYLGIGLDPDIPSDKQPKHWFLMENANKPSYFGVMTTSDDLIKAGISLVM